MEPSTRRALAPFLILLSGRDCCVNSDLAIVILQFEKFSPFRAALE